MKKVYPDWVEKHHKKGTSIKQIGNNYYLYAVTSHYSKEKAYPVSDQRYIGKITQKGLVEPEKISFIPGTDKLVLLKDAADLSAISETERTLLADIPVLVKGENIYTGHLNRKQSAAVRRHFKFEDGVIRI